MIYFSKVGIMSCGFFLLCLGLSTVAQAADATSTADNQPTGAKIITGEVLRVEGNDCYVKGEDGKEVRLHIDVTTLKAKNNIEPGDRIEAKVNDQNHALSVYAGAEIQDRRNVKD